MIVVVLLIAISATFVVVNLDRGSDKVAELEARRFAELLEQARDESILSGRAHAVAVNAAANSYEFMRHQEEWIPIDDDDMFRRRRIPEDLNVSLQLSGGPGGPDMLVVDGLGEITPFELSIRGESRVYTVSLDVNQNLAVTDAPPD